jgi:hypothetical protein
VVFVTHLCQDRVVTSALSELEAAGLVDGKCTHLRIED